MQLLVYALVGLSAGVLGSMLGVGGGILMVPAMVYLCKLEFKHAAAMSLAVMIPMAATSTIRNLSNAGIRPGMKLSPILLMSVLAIGGALLGTWLSAYISGTTLKKIFAVLMAIVAVNMFFEKAKAKPEARDVGGGAASTSAAVSPDAGAEHP